MFSNHIGRYDFASYGSLSPPLYMSDNSAFLCCIGKYPFLKQSFIIWIRIGAVISEVFWYISAMTSSGPLLYLPLVYVCILISPTFTASYSSMGSLSPITASSSFKNRFHYLVRSFLPVCSHRYIRLFDGGHDDTWFLVCSLLFCTSWTMNLCSCYPRRTFPRCFLWQSYSCLVFLKAVSEDILCPLPGF